MSRVGFHFSSGSLTCDGLPVAEIAATVGTPVYVYSTGIVRARFDALQAAFAAVPHAIHYALKANSTLGMLRFIRGLGAGADANSVGEIEVALRAGFIPEQIVFTGVGKSRDELERAVALGVKAINAESAGELERIDAIARAQGTRARVALRVNPDIDAQTLAKISTGKRGNKFGVPIDAAATVLQDVRSRAGLEIVGVHAHIGSQISSIEPLRRAARAITDLARQLRADGLPIEHVDVGGGLGVAYDGVSAPDVAAYGQAIAEEVRDSGLVVILEPGRWLMAPAGVLVATVVDVKPAPDERLFVVLDAGMTELIRPALYGAFHRIAPVVARPDAVPLRVDVVGPVCESSDVFGTDRELPEPAVDDLIAIQDVGAYGSVMSSNYNRRPQPPEVMAEDGAWRLIRRRQTIEEQMGCEI